MLRPEINDTILGHFSINRVLQALFRAVGQNMMLDATGASHARERVTARTTEKHRVGIPAEADNSLSTS